MINGAMAVLLLIDGSGSRLLLTVIKSSNIFSSRVLGKMAQDYSAV